MTEDLPTSPEELLDGVDPEILAETRRILGEWVGFDPAMPIAERDSVTEAEAVRLNGLTQQASEAFAEQSLREWEQQHPGQRAGHLESARARETGWRAAREMVLAQQLYPRVTSQTTREVEEADALLLTQVRTEREAARTAQDPDRWRRREVVPMPLASRIVERVWLDRPGPFRMLAQALITQRIQDGQPVPQTAADPLVANLEQMVTDELQDNPPADPHVPF